MKMKLYILLTVIIFGCSAPKKEATSSADSTTVSQDSVDANQDIAEAPQQVEETASASDSEQPPFDGESNNFPLLRMGAISTDSLELEVNEAFGKMMDVADTISYSRITSSYSWERPYYARGQEGEGFMSSESEEETKTWLFDRNYQLKGYSVEFTTGPDYPFTKSVVYLFSNDSLKAVSELEVDESEVTVTNHLRMLASKCPRCGFSISEGGGPEPRVTYLTQQEMAAKQEEFDKSLTDLIRILKSKRNGAKIVEDDFVFTINRTKEGNTEDKTKTITYPVKFVVAKQLYYNYTPIK